MSTPADIARSLPSVPAAPSPNGHLYLPPWPDRAEPALELPRTCRTTAYTITLVVRRFGAQGGGTVSTITPAALNAFFTPP